MKKTNRAQYEVSTLGAVSLSTKDTVNTTGYIRVKGALCSFEEGIFNKSKRCVFYD